MVFSSNVFVFFFLPVVLAGYFLILRKRSHRNLFLTAVSLCFYAWGEPAFVLVMLASIFANWLFGLWVDKRMRAGQSKRLPITLMCVFNLGLLGVFKYLMFIMNNLNWAFGLHLPVPEIVLPIGISFFTFQAMSYVIDVSRGQGIVQKNFFNVCLYVSFFPQLIAGPIVRYQTVSDEIENRKENADDFVEGVWRFLTGFAKKMILSNNLGLLVDTVFAYDQSQMSVVTMWIAAFAYQMQVYYDFSGYSDMAIGLGRMFGFHFLENFDYPLLSKSVAGFWRRWHMSLGSFFRDYVYFPLGGSRVKTPRWLFNMCVVWTLTGLWHGAEWTYVIWGFLFFVLQAVEKLTGLGKWMEKHPVGYLYANAMIVMVTVLIRSANLSDSALYYGTMFGLNGAPLVNEYTMLCLREYGWFVLGSVLFGLPIASTIRKKTHMNETLATVIRTVFVLGITGIALSYAVMGGYNPFIYFNF